MHVMRTLVFALGWASSIDVIHSSHSTWTWSEQLCVDFGTAPQLPSSDREPKGPGRLCTTIYASQSNLTEAATFGVVSLCGYSSQYTTVANCCSSAECIGEITQQLYKRVKYGARTVDASGEVEARNRKGDRFTLALNAVAKLVPSPVVLVQVGANVGAQDHDPCYPHIVAGEIDIAAMLFEPLPVQHHELQVNYNNSMKSGKRKPTYIRSAICPSDSLGKELTFVYSKPPTRLVNEDVDRWKMRLYDYFYRTHHSQMGRLETTMGAKGSSTTEKDFASEDWLAGTSHSNPSIPISVKVPCTTIAHEMQKTRSLPNNRIDVLVIDAEGSDLIVLKSAFDYLSSIPETLYPGIVLFEHTGLDAGGKTEAIKVLDENDYVCEMYGMMDVLCLHLTVTKSSPEMLSMIHLTHPETVQRKHEIKDSDMEAAVRIMVDDTMTEVPIHSTWRIVNSAVLACISHLILVQDCSRLAENMVKIVLEL